MPPQVSQPAWQGWSNKAPGWVEFLKAANEDFDDIYLVGGNFGEVPSVTHGEGLTLEQSERGQIIVALMA